ncbi:MAG: monofunctional biosynthetic peptidoglycan transglycosylase [Bacteroidia bacterium]
MFIKLGRLIKRIVVGFFVISIGLVVIYRFVPPPVTPLMITRLFDQAANDQPLRLSKDWKPLEKMSTALPQAVIAAEDQRFLEHWGFDIQAIQKAIEEREKRKRVRGASTISQQVAKNVFLWQGRSWIRKGFEVYFTVLIELIWPKRRIIEIYLNVAEMGNGIYGAEMAANTYFNRAAKDVSTAQAALLAAILPSPLRYSATNPSPYIRDRQAWIMGQMRNLGPLDLAGASEKN